MNSHEYQVNLVWREGRIGEINSPVLNQKIGKAILITDNSQSFYAPPVMYKADMMVADAGAPRETLAVGEIEVSANVSVSFILE